MNSSLAITSKRQAIGHIPTTILSQIKRMFSLMRMLRIPIRNHHLRKRQPIKDRSHISLIIECYIIQNNTLLIIEPHMEIPVLPIDNAVINLK